MAKKKGDRIVIRLKSTESEYIYYSEKNKRNDTARLEITEDRLLCLDNDRAEKVLGVSGRLRQPELN